MTLTHRYNELMDRVRVSEEMADRILARVHEADPQPAAPPKPLLLFKRWGPLAACLALLIFGGISLPRLLPDLPSPAPDQSAPGPDADRLSSAAELSTSLGFRVEDISGLPFEVREAVYTAHRRRLAEIVYAGDGMTATFRRSQGTADNSGDHGTYGSVRTLNVGNVDATLKGSSGKYTLAIWSEGPYCNSLRLSSGLTEAQWRAVLAKNLLRDTRS